MVFASGDLWGKLDHLDFPATAKREFGISAVEYVNGFFGSGKTDFREAAKSAGYLKELLTRSRDAGVVNHLLMVDSLRRLGEFAEPMKTNVVVENHGGETSNGAWLADVVRQVSRPNVGTLPDFGNFCISHPWEDEGIRKTKALLEKYL